MDHSREGKLTRAVLKSSVLKVQSAKHHFSNNFYVFMGTFNSTLTNLNYRLDSNCHTITNTITNLSHWLVNNNNCHSWKPKTEEDHYQVTLDWLDTPVNGIHLPPQSTPSCLSDLIIIDIESNNTEENRDKFVINLTRENPSSTR